MNDELQRDHLEAAGINAVHCAIYANDAVRVLQSQFKEEDAQNAAKRLGTIISKKSRIEYEQEPFSLICS